MTYHVLIVCTGNICRSPMAEHVLRRSFEEAGLGDEVEVTSRGTTSWEDGEPVDPRARAVLEEHGIDPSGHRARQATGAEVRDADLVIALDEDHVRPLRRLAGSAGVDVRMLRSFDPEAGDDLGIRDPWYGDDSDFELTWDLILAAAPGVVEHVRRELDGADGSGEQA